MSKIKMTDKEVTAQISQLSDWKVVEAKLHREFKFSNFVEAFAFMTKVAIVAEKMDHHPELFNVYNRVVIDLATHDVDGISTLDIELAKKINTLQPTESIGEPAVEWLKFQVLAQQQARFIEQDAAIWTPIQMSYSGFQSKEIWTNLDSPNELVIITHWASFDQWKAIPKEVLDRTTQSFNQAMGKEYTPESMSFRLA